MISRISLLKCKEGVSEEAFREGMMGDVRDVIARMPQLRKCEIDFVTDRQQRSHLGRGAIDIDGFIEMFFDSYGDMQQAMDEAGDALLAALEPLVEEPVSTLVAVKKVDTPVPAYLDGKAIKRVSFCDRAEGVDAATFHDEWWYTHSLLVKLMSGYCGYNQNLVIDRMVQGASVHSADLPVEGMVVRGHGRVRRVLQPGRFQAARERARSGVHRHRHDVFRRSRACGAAELDEVRTASRTRRDAVLFGRGALL